ncbi:VCBS repeat-containing protein [Belliella sp. R4-6]|uniref:VCBS repeat-containing protein n=1 Tax=Belliella alkalica TaxID=1730871 RepID=A0ABS9VDU0_9BACT|nr:VCBS repeat-containing protein [Belliella alkalica]MCH7414115.1 VCBS repeat-containing protein [Belliella alkalica]
MFKLLPSSKTGVDFNNFIEINDEFNILDFDYIYNGGGIAVGDFNNDGLPDLFFTGNKTSSRLYINQGNLKFKDVSEASNTITNFWAEGVTLVDINHDGLLDIYICVSNRDESNPNPNLLFVNQGINEEGVPVFKEMASDYGIDDRGYNTQAAFFDYDLDGYLDLYILSNAMESFQRNTSRPREKTGRGKSNDKLYRNNGDGTFSNVTQESGILIEGYGLGLAISDINNDGYPDIYVANDFITNDILYINNGDGTFSNQIDSMLKHQSFNAMGVDIADFNNDGLMDIVVLDMLPPDNYRQKTMFAPTANYDLFVNNLGKGYEPQYVRNTLQLNQGNGLFSEIGYLAGIAQTDWSWSPLFADFDNDGNKDLFVSNGYGKDVTDLDHINFKQNLSTFTTQEERRAYLLEGMASLKDVSLTNYIYKNNGDLTFADKSSDWGMTHASISNGAVYTDLDNDGDLDIVINNLNEEAHIYQNLLIDKDPETAKFLRLHLKGPKLNSMGLGAKLLLEYRLNGKSDKQFYEHYPTRGYKSFVEPVAHFGIPKDAEIIKLTVTWPDGKKQILNNLSVNQTIQLKYIHAVHLDTQLEEKTIFSYEEISAQVGILHIHQHQNYNDFNRQRLLPHKHSENGPGMAVGDVNGDGLDDLFVGGSAGYPRYLFIQNQKGNFIKKEILTEDYADDMGCLLIDIDHDGDLDLYIVSGGSRYADEDPNYTDRLYINDGKGNFKRFEGEIPNTNFSGSSVVAADVDGNGDFEIFVGGRVKPGRYPLSPPSVMLRYKEGQFIDITEETIPEIANAGMVTSALWTDFDDDGLLDLIIVGEWMSVTFFQQVKKDGKVSFENVSDTFIVEKSQGWWNSIHAMGKDENGNPQYILGNAGKNTRWDVSTFKPLILIADDFDKNQSIDPILFSYLVDGHYPVEGRDKLISQVPSWRNRFLKYSEFAKYKLEDFFTEEQRENAFELKAYQLESAMLKKDKAGKFTLHPLPLDSQLAPTFGLHYDYREDLIFTIGNFYGNESVTGRYDAAIGNVISRDERGNYTKSKKHSGFLIDKEGRSMVSLTRKNGESMIIASQHQGSIKAFKKYTASRDTKHIHLENDDYKVRFMLDNEDNIELEFTYGNGYLSQSSRIIPIPKNCSTVIVKKFNGKSREIQTSTIPYRN